MTQDERWIREKTTDVKRCSECKGKCCKSCGCSYFPKDLDMSFENLIELINEREISIDAKVYKNTAYDPLKTPIYYLRASNVKEEKIAIGKLGVCHLLTEQGCKLSYDDRPSGGRLLVPFWSGCYPLYSVDEFIDAWTPYQELIKKIIDSIEKDC